MSSEVKEIMSLREFAKFIGLSTNGVLKAISEDRISNEYVRKNDKGHWEFFADMAASSYYEKTNGAKSINRDDFEDEEYSGPKVFDESGNELKSIFDVPDRYWTANQAHTGKTIFQARMAKLALEVEQGKFYVKKDVDSKLQTITKLFADGLKMLPEQLRQRHPDTTKQQLKTIEKLVDEIRKNVADKL